MPHILALDEGTTSARAALYDECGRRLTMHSQPFTSTYPQPGWVEQNPDEIWTAQLACARSLLAERPVKLDGLGITNQRETTIVWDRKTGRAVAPAIVWQCRRTAEFCGEIASSKMAHIVTAKTGLEIDAYFSASKIRWILNAVPDGPQKARDGEILFGNVDTWLIWKLTNGACHVTDYSNASRTMLMNIADGDWDSELLNLFDVPRAMLPRIVNSSEVVAESAPEHLGQPVKIAGIAGDQQAALAGQACFQPGLSKNTYGTGCFVLMHTGGRRPVSRNRLLATRAASTSSAPQFAIEGSVFIAGAAVQWLRDRLRLISTAAESEAIASSVSGTGGIYVVPAFVGLGAPYWNSSAKGIITGLTLGTGAPEIVRATLESIAYQTRDLVEAMQADTGEQLKELRVDGGAAANNFLMQFQADILGCPIVRPADTETTALGAAYLAGLACGVWKNTEELEQFWAVERRFEPSISEGRRESLYAGWKDAIARCQC